MSEKVYVWVFGDGPTEWVAATSKKEAFDVMIRLLSKEEVEEYYPEDEVKALTDAELDRLKFYDEDGAETVRTFREELHRMIAGGEVPGMMASTEC